MARKFTVTHADGTVSTRTSAKANYTHAVVLTTPKAGAVAVAERALVEAERLAAARADDACEEVQEDRRSAPYIAPGAVSVSLRVGSIWVGSYYEGENLPERVESARPTDEDIEARLAEYIADDEKRVDEAREHLADVKANAPEFDYEVMRWSSRADLAHKAVKEFEPTRARWSGTLTVVEVD